MSRKWFSRMSYDPKQRAYTEAFNSLSFPELPTGSVTRPITPKAVDTAVTCMINLPTGLQLEWANQMKSRNSKQPITDWPRAPVLSFSFFLSILRLPFHSLPSPFLSLLLSSFPPLLFSSFFPSPLPFLPTDRKFADGDQIIGGCDTPTPPLATALGLDAKWYYIW